MISLQSPPGFEWDNTHQVRRGRQTGGIGGGLSVEHLRFATLVPVHCAVFTPGR